MKNNLIIILCHCDTPEKLEILQSNINKLKTKEFSILLVSHIPIPFDIQKQVEYFIYDKDNPIFTLPFRGFRMWVDYPYKPNKTLRLQSHLPDYGWTVFNQYIKAGLFSLSLDYDYYSLINYDIKLTEKIFKDLFSPPSCLIGKVKDSNGTLIDNGLIFNIFDKSIYQYLLSLLSKEEFLSKYEDNVDRDGLNFKYGTAESYWDYILSNLNYNNTEYYIEDSIDFGNPNPFNQNTYNNDFKIFLGNNDFYIYDIKVPFVKLKINNKILDLDNTSKTIKVEEDINSMELFLDGKFYNLISQDNNHKTIRFIDA